ncbi:MAG: hypothetical protein ABIR58_08430 [Gemmatimonadaceae bacterium]
MDSSQSRLRDRLQARSLVPLARVLEHWLLASDNPTVKAQPSFQGIGYRVSSSPPRERIPSGGHHEGG